MEVLEAIKGRRSVRKYKATPVDDRTLELVLEGARRAPSWRNSQCWRFIVVRDESIKAELAKTLNKNLATDAINPATEAIMAAPVVILACAELGKSGYYRVKLAADEGDSYQQTLATDKGDWYMFDVALAMQNLVLAAHSLGLGTVHVGLFDAKEAARILDVPDGFCVVSMTPLGYPDEQPEARPRKELSEIVFYDRYGRTQSTV